MEPNEAMKAMAERIADDHTGANNRGNHLWEPRYDAALAAIMETRDVCAKLAESMTLEMPGIGIGLADGASLARRQIATAIRTGEHYALAGDRHG